MHSSLIYQTSQGLESEASNWLWIYAKIVYTNYRVSLKSTLPILIGTLYDKYHSKTISTFVEKLL